jgi:HEAT repeats
VADKGQVTATALLAVRKVQVEPADDAVPITRHGIAIRVIIRGSVGPPRDLSIRDPLSAGIMMCVGFFGELGSSPSVAPRESHADPFIGERSRRTRRGGARKRHAGELGGADDPAGAQGVCPDGAQRDDDQGRSEGPRHGSKGLIVALGRAGLLAKESRREYPSLTMPSRDPAATLKALFDAERAVRAAHDELVEADPATVSPLLERATREALKLDALDEDESSLRLVRVALLLGEMQGTTAVDLLIDIIGCDEPEARQSAGEALSALAWDRFKDVALGIERALDRLPEGSPALSEIPYLLAELPEPGAVKLLARFLAHKDPEAVAAAIEALVETGDPAALPMLEPLVADTRRVQLEDDGGTQGEATIAELVAEARTLLSKGSL